MTKNIFKVSDEEAKRIRVLHESESENKKIDSSLITEQAQCGGQGQTPGKAVHWQGCPGTPNLLNPFPCAMVDNQTPHSGMIGWKINVGGGHMGFWCDNYVNIKLWWESNIINTNTFRKVK